MAAPARAGPGYVPLDEFTVDDRDADVESFCGSGEDDEACVIRYGDEQDSGGSVEILGERGSLLAAVRRCNIYDPLDFVPVVVGSGGNGELVGHANQQTMRALAPYLAARHMCELEEVDTDETSSGGFRKSQTVRLAPRDDTVEARTATAAALVAGLVADGLIPPAKVRNELQDVHPVSRGFVGGRSPPVEPSLYLERAAMIYLGVPSYGVHVNGWVRDPARPLDPRPWGMWVARRSLGKATYAGLLDQMVAGGQPSGITFRENVLKECQEEASLPPEVLATLRPAGLVSYRYTTRKGLSTKVLATYDVELPAGLAPHCSDGEVEEFRLLPIAEVLDSIRLELPLWKPNSAMVVVDFAMRHGFIDFDEPGYMEIAHLLRNGGVMER